MGTRSETIKKTIARKMAEGTWHVPEWTDEQKAKRAATLRRNAIGRIQLRTVGRNTYRMVMTEDGYRYEHRLVMEAILGRRLERREHVHHINKDGLDNRPENLEVLTVAEHTSRHFIGTTKTPEHRAKIAASNKLTRAKRAQE